PLVIAVRVESAPVALVHPLPQLRQRLERGRVHSRLGELGAALGELYPDQDVDAVALAGFEQNSGAFLEAAQALLEVTSLGAQALGVLGQADLPLGSPNRQGPHHPVEIDFFQPGSLDVAALGPWAHKPQADEHGAAVLVLRLEHHVRAWLEAWIR